MQKLTRLPPNLPSIPNAKLPEAYLAARAAIAAAAKVDECKTWADKSAALASYAKQSADEALYRHALKIRARAIERCGALLCQIEATHGRHKEKVSPPTPFRKTRKAAADAAGLSERRKNEALRVHNYAKTDPSGFEEAVEGPKPATVPELAKRGTKPAPPPLFDHLNGRSPEDFKAATKALGALNWIARETACIDKAAAMRGCAEHEKLKAIKNAKIGLAWIKDMLARLEK